jgi:hypothetical protein
VMIRSCPFLRLHDFLGLRPVGRRLLHARVGAGAAAAWLGAFNEVGIAVRIGKLVLGPLICSKVEMRGT